MSKKDYYETLGVAKNASQDEIKRVYRKLAMKYHPDRNPGDKEAERKFKELNDAYEVLKDDSKRAAYDRYGDAAFGNGAAGAGGGFQSGFGEDFSDFADVFSNIFGSGFGSSARGSRKKSNAVRGSDLRYNLSITLEEAYHGKKHTIKYKTGVKCDPCGGTGRTNRSGYTSCLACGGTGAIRVQQGFFTVETACRTCSGTGSVIKDPCKSCHGQGRVEKEKSVAVSIPAGVEDETKIRVSGEGEAGLKGSPSGDLYIFVSIKKHPIFKRKDNDLYCDLPIKFTTAVLGGKVEVPCINGATAILSIPAGTQSGSQFRLAGKGMLIMKSNNVFGDLYVKAALETPINLTIRQKELLEEFEKESSTGSSPESESFFQRVKNFWGDKKDK
ncbi:MAG: molecular chaperone DnaJ [Candidatus Midichloria mitochondrii]|uniref:Chaperone protein DnaJ n=1 Tax=Midichloria mitochondrii (strain IricVA) TaxID=696127 RepID=F7XVG6_MIDMI|nr:molecular chaperone DnaJ [Candidatus Midichloria mitochondrii]AEI88665.1 chaperone protein DnaJ [Candidatus Midichloria mitochondrii IricVA]MDJ1256995.1 molecular chaperone DnaJ [Candidatus Midichloria mitochondrii]MDJ1288744.1 molecular chaperone DnaJ [Candidatus Midichloria mitochondrii]MDJ1299566.1 molecular chaperone DnaJ [Candidatus Midichloria mitochondrii]MDJ1313474.1 molecular chaperone DnaJ [Candidatus Midichloria mitochondrii]